MRNRMIVAIVVAATMAVGGQSLAVGPIEAAPNWTGPLYGLSEAGLSADPVEGSLAQVQRAADGITFSVSTRNLQPNHAVTNWLIVWNNPLLCVDPDTARGFKCGTGDFGNVAAGFSVMYGTGAVVAGTAHTFTGARQALDLSGIVLGPGLVDPQRAEVKIIVRDHGVASDDPAMREAQTTTLDGGCSNPVFPLGLFGAPGDQTCTDVQATGLTG